MSKMNLQDLQSLFTVAKVNGNKKISKHQASKKGYKHNWNPSKGERKDISNGKWGRAMFMKYGITK